MEEALKRRIGRDFLTDPHRNPEAHRKALWHLLQALEKITEDTDSPALEAAVEGSLELLEYEDWAQHFDHGY